MQLIFSGLRKQRYCFSGESIQGQCVVVRCASSWPILRSRLSTMDVRLMLVAVGSRLTLIIDKLSTVVSNVKKLPDAVVCYLK